MVIVIKVCLYTGLPEFFVFRKMKPEADGWPINRQMIHASQDTFTFFHNGSPNQSFVLS